VRLRFSFYWRLDGFAGLGGLQCHVGVEVDAVLGIIEHGPAGLHGKFIGVALPMQQNRKGLPESFAAGKREPSLPDAFRLARGFVEGDARHAAGVVATDLLAEIDHRHGFDPHQHLITPGDGSLACFLRATIHGLIKPLGDHLSIAAEVDYPAPGAGGGLKVLDGVHRVAFHRLLQFSQSFADAQANGLRLMAIN
jgi:hypothetical protein